MTDTSQNTVRRPRPFSDTLLQIRYGELNEELAVALNELVEKVSNTGKPGKLALTLSLKPGKSGQIEIADEMKVTLPKEERGHTIMKEERGHTIMFATPEGNLQREDPRQRSIEGIRSVDQEAKALREARDDRLAVRSVGGA